MSGSDSGITTEQRLAFANLHDVFMNASLQRSLMVRQGPGALAEARKSSDPVLAFTSSDYGRLERCWVAFLYVLVEAWVHPDTAEAIKLIGTLVPAEKVTAALAEGGWAAGKKLRDLAGCPLAQMRDVRHYMAHRDKREYWDAGRTALVGLLAFHNRLHEAFSEVFLSSISEMRKRGWLIDVSQGESPSSVD